jgi:hypothetical protein
VGQRLGETVFLYRPALFSSMLYLPPLPLKTPVYIAKVWRLANVSLVNAENAESGIDLKNCIDNICGLALNPRSCQDPEARDSVLFYPRVGTFIASAVTNAWQTSTGRGGKVKFAETIEVLNPKRIHRFVTIGME